MGMDIQDVTFAIRAQDGATAVLRQVRSAMGEVGKSYASLAATAGVVAAAAYTVVRGFTAIVTEAKQAEDQSKRLTAVLRATGNSAGLAKDELDAMADTLAEISQFDDESIRSAEATFLKFGNIQKGVFEEGLSLAADYAAFLGTDMPGAAQAIGKALSSPTLGLKNLQNELGRLTPEQERSIQKFMEQGKVMEAQGVVLDFLRGKIKGAAAEMNTGFTGALSSVSKSFGELAESIGKSVVGDAAKSFLNFLTQSMKDMKAIVDNGTWVDKLKNISLFMLGFRGMDMPESGSRVSTGKIGGLKPGPMPKTEEQLKREKEAVTAARKARDDALKAVQDGNEKSQIARYDAAQEAAIEAGKWRLQEIKSLKEQDEALTTSAEKYRDLLDPMRAYVRELEQIDKLQKSGKLSVEEARAAEMDVQMRQMEESQKAFGDFKKNGKEATDELVRAFEGWGRSVSKSFADMVVDGEMSFGKLRDSARNLLRDIIAMSIDRAITQKVVNAGAGLLDRSIAGLGSQIGSLFGGGGGFTAQDMALADAPFLSLGNYATGGSFMVGGDGGTDTTPINFMATRGERVTVETPGQQRGGDGGGVTVHLNFALGVSQTVRAEMQSMLPQIVGAAAAGVADASRRSLPYSRNVQGA